MRFGRGNAVLGYRAAYSLGVSRIGFDNIDHINHPTFCKEETHLGPAMFNNVFKIVEDDLNKAFDLELEEEDDGSNAKKPRERIFGEQRFFFSISQLLVTLMRAVWACAS